VASKIFPPRSFKSIFNILIIPCNKPIYSFEKGWQYSKIDYEKI